MQQERTEAPSRHTVADTYSSVTSAKVPSGTARRRLPGERVETPSGHAEPDTYTSRTGIRPSTHRGALRSGGEEQGKRRQGGEAVHRRAREGREGGYGARDGGTEELRGEGESAEAEGRQVEADLGSWLRRGSRRLGEGEGGDDEEVDVQGWMQAAQGAGEALDMWVEAVYWALNRTEGRSVGAVGGEVGDLLYE